MDKDIITVTSPLLPSLDDFQAELRKIWDSKWITNNGSYHRLLERELAAYLKVPQLSLFTNGTLPLITSLQALRITGEVITRPIVSWLPPTPSGGTASSLCLSTSTPLRATSTPPG